MADANGPKELPAVDFRTETLAIRALDLVNEQWAEYRLKHRLGEIEAQELLLDQRSRRQASQTVSTNEARDAWMYEEKKAGKTHNQIRCALTKAHSEWDQFANDQAVGSAIDRYCDRHQLPRLRRKRKPQ